MAKKNWVNSSAAKWEMHFYNRTVSDLSMPLVPLPLFARRERKRGYNQATVLCEGIAETMNLPLLKKVIQRNTHTETQTHKGRLERWKNIEGKFTLMDDAAICNRHILLVDDVITTGATLEACGIELLRADGVKLSIATLAYTSS